MDEATNNTGVPDILARILTYKKTEVAERRGMTPMSLLESAPEFVRPVYSLAASLKKPGSTGIIAEFKRRSPSKGVINDLATVDSVTTAYASSGAAALSVLTDGPSFGGDADDLVKARKHALPILRKDFIIDTYQIAEARAMGADVILLIAACLPPAETRRLAAYAKSLHMEVLLEIHGEQELDRMNEYIDVVGVNNRDLRRFTVDIDRSIKLLGLLPAHLPKVAESGIRDPETVRTLRRAGFDGFLIGEQFMKHPDPAKAFADFTDQLKREPV